MKNPHQILSRFVFVCVFLVALSCSKDDDPTTVTPPAAPVAVMATNLTQTGFTATWNAVDGAKSYLLDVSADNFATFAGAYNSKSVTGTSEVVTGLTAGTTYNYRVRASNDGGASANSNVIAVITLSDIVVGKVDGVDFKPSTIALTDTNAGLELSFKDATNDFSFRLSEKTDGTYDIENIFPSARRQAPAKIAIAFWTKGGKVFYGSTGTITTATVSGKVNVTFSLSGQSDDGTTSEISNGKIDNLSIGSIPSGQCVLTGYQEASEENDDVAFGYDSQGRLIQIVESDDSWNFFWVGSKVAKAIYYSEDEVNVETWTYNGNLLSQVTATHTSDWDNTDNYKLTLEYTGNKVSKTTRIESMGETVKNNYTNTVTFNGDNVTQIKRDRTEGGDSDTRLTVYENYDTKNNFWLLLANALNNPFPLGSEEGIDAQFLSKNNAGKATYSFEGNEIAIQTFTFKTYTSSGYPIDIDYTYSEGEDYNVSSSVKMLYSGCGN